jgi:hypothetical protein
MATLADARRAKERLSSRIGRHPAVNGLGITRVDGGFAVKVNLRHAPGDALALPKEIDGVRVHVDVVGPITKRA